MWCAPRSVSCLCFQCVHYLRRGGKSQFPTQHFPWEHDTKIPSVRSFFSLICEKAPLRGALAHLSGVSAQERSARADFGRAMHCVLAGVGAETGAYNGFVKFKMYRIFFAEEVDFLQKRAII